VPDHVENWGLLRDDGVTRPTEDELPVARALRGETVAEQELVLARPDGAALTVLARAAPIRDSERRVVGAVATWRDLTEQKRAAERERMLGLGLALVRQLPQDLHR
jgi:PAS domain S-box-containing protein